MGIATVVNSTSTSWIRCPRCGYDLSALPPTWEAACPLYGLCSECGYEVEWSVVLDPQGRVPGWFFEAEIFSRWAWGRVFVQTWLAALVPWMFWKRVRLETPVRIRCLWWFAAVALVVGGGLRIGVEWVFLLGMSQLAGGALVDAVVSVRILTEIFTLIGLCTLLPAGAVLVLPQSRRAAKVRPAHVWRAAVYGTPGLSVVICLYWLQEYAAALGWIPFLVEPGYLLAAPPAALVTVSLLWVVIWWSGVVILYMRMRHAMMVIVSIALLTFLGIMAYHGVVYWL